MSTQLKDKEKIKWIDISKLSKWAIEFIIWTNEKVAEAKKENV